MNLVSGSLRNASFGLPVPKGTQEMRIVASLLVIVIVAGATADDSKPRVPDRLFSDTWHAFETVGPNDQVFFENPAKYWSELSYEMFFVFAARAVEPTRDEWCEYFVNQFAETRWHWLSANRSYTQLP